MPALRHPVQVSAGLGGPICALDDDGVHCWGRDYDGKTNVPPLRQPTQVGAGMEHVCALDQDGVHCWGYNGQDQINVPQGLDFIGRHACLLADGRVRCVGQNQLGQLGVGNADESVRPIAMAPATDLGQAFGSVAELAVGHGFSCALGDSGSVKCWGRNTVGQLGLGDTRDRGTSKGDMGDALPRLVFGDSPMTKLDVGQDHACALSPTDEVFCWGDGSSGQLGTEAAQSVGTTGGPVRAHLKTGLVVRDLALGQAHSCLLTAEGQVYCFGKNDGGQLGLGRSGNIGDRPETLGEAMQPVALGAQFSVTSIASGANHVCALSRAGTVKCWGANDVGQLGLGDTRSRGTVPSEMGDALPTVDLGHGQVAIDLDCGFNHCCVRTIQNTMMCWGDNGAGQLGLGDEVTRGATPSSMGDALPFVMTPPGERVLSMRLYGYRTCARTDSGLRCWGRNSGGELGYGDQDDRGGSPSTIPRLLPSLGI
jgi:alpha-tubulin suppressor-like RCC1 family protein